MSGSEASSIKDSPDPEFYYPHPEPRAELKWALIDLDGTLAEPVWTPQNPTSIIGLPILANLEKAMQLHEKGWKIVIHTSRSWTDYEAIEAWCRFYGLPVSRIVCGKLLGGVMIDDRNVSINSPDWSDPDGEWDSAFKVGYLAGYEAGVKERKR